MATPPETDRDPVTEEFHGEVVSDPYRWLEADSEAVADWEAHQNAFTDTVVETERRESLAPAFEALGSRASYFLPTVRGGRYFQRIEGADADQPALTVRERVDGSPETLVDPAGLGETTALQWFAPDRTGEHVLYGLIDAGTEQYDLRVRAVSDGEVVDRIDDVGRCNPESVAWDDDGFYYLTTGAAGDGDQLDKALRYHALGGEDRLVTAAFEPERWPTVQTDRETGLVVVTVGELAAESELYVLTETGLDPVVTGHDAMVEPLVHDGQVYALTGHDAPRRRLLGTDAASFPEADGLDDLETVVPESGDVLLDVTPAGDGIAVSKLRDAQSALSLHRPDGTERHEVSLPAFAGIPRDGIEGSDETAEVFVRLTGLDRPESVVHVEAGEPNVRLSGRSRPGPVPGRTTGPCSSGPTSPRSTTRQRGLH